MSELEKHRLTLAIEAVTEAMKKGNDNMGLLHASFFLNKLRLSYDDTSE